jgi:Fe-S-cluster containining protein
VGDGRTANKGATEQRFACTACGKCCFGWLPLTLEEAFAQAGRFPLAMAWTPVPRNTRAFDLTAQFGTTVHLPNRKQVAVLIAPTAYLPSSFPCPALSEEGLCAIQADKPLRCRTMPFYPYRREEDQADMLVPRKGWVCDVSEHAPVVYRQRRIVDRADFDGERAALLAQAPVLRAYADTLLRLYPAVMAQLLAATRNPAKGSFVTGFASFLRHGRQDDAIGFAKQQHPVLIDVEARTTGTPKLAEYCAFYRQSAAELAWFARRV